MLNRLSRLVNAAGGLRHAALQFIGRPMGCTSDLLQLLASAPFLVRDILGSVCGSGREWSPLRVVCIPALHLCVDLGADQYDDG